MKHGTTGGGPSGPPPTPVAADVPQLADGIELIGEYSDSGYIEPPFIARRADGQILQLSRLLYLVAEQVDGQRSFEEIAQRVTQTFGRGVSADNVRVLVEDKLRPLGVLAAADGSSPPLSKANAMLALRFRTAVVPESAVRAITSVFKPLFWPVVVVGILAAVLGVDFWFFFIHGVGQGLRSTIYEPTTMLLVLGLVTLSAAFHECGHATGCKYGGARPGVMGAGIYIVWPAFYTNVTDSYRLGKGGRLRTDLGGIYFNLIFVIATVGAYAVTRFEPLLLVVLVQHMEILRHFFPFVRLDGYYVVSDVTGVPDLFARIKPILRSLKPGAERPHEVTQLKRWVRWTVTGWVFTVIPLLLFNVILIVMHLPRIVATTFDSFLLQWQRLQEALAAGGAAAIGVGVLQLVLLLLPPLGIALMFGRIANKLMASGWAATDDSPGLRAGLATAALGVTALAAFVWWPNGDYKPLQEGERLTLQEASVPLSAITTGRPGLTVEREEALGGAPPLSDSGDTPVGSETDAGGQEPVEPVTTEQPAADASPTPGEQATIEPTEEPSPATSPADVEPSPAASPADVEPSPADDDVDPIPSPTTSQ